MIARISDPLTTERVGKLIEDIQARKRHYIRRRYGHS
jgi:uncharacterized protein VirK/YbjX